MADIARHLVLALADGQSSSAFQDQFESGYRADAAPYGLENLPTGWIPGFVDDRPGSADRSAISSRLARTLQFDAINAMRRREQWVAADVVYGHTEKEYLGIAFARRVLRVKRPLVVGQTVWLFAELERYSRVRRALLAWLFGGVDVFVHNARPNYELAQRLLPRHTHVYVPFGVSARYDEPGERPEPLARPLVLTVGGDRARDWHVMREVLAGVSLRADVRVASDSRLEGFEFAEVGRTGSIAELKALHRRCSVMVIAARANRHASGITAILEAAASGTPVIATRTGGLDAYFDDDEVLFVPEGDGSSMSRALARFLDDPSEASAFGRRLRNRWMREDYSNRGYWERVTDALLPSLEGRG